MKRNKIFKLVCMFTAWVASIAMLAGLSSCREELELLSDDGYDMFTASVGCDIAGAQPLRSRAASQEFSDGLQNPEKASIIIILFDENNYLTNVYSGTFKDVTMTDENGASLELQHIIFNVKMKEVKEKRILHIIVNHPTLKPDDVEYGSESAVMNSDVMTVNEGHDVYWQRLELDELTEESVQNKLAHVALIRNYAKLTLNIALDDATTEYTMGDPTASTHTATEIKSIQWALMCVPTKGSVAPYISGQKFATYTKDITSEHVPDIACNYTTLYQEGYRCNVPRKMAESSEFYRDDAAADAEHLIWTDYTQPLYQFENEGYSSSSIWKKTVIIFKVILYKGGTDADSGDDGTVYYYRVGLTDPTRNYESLYVFRNIQYDITITAVKEGMDTPADAFSKVAANNISGSTRTESYTNVTTDAASLRVQYTKKYILSPATFTMKARYVPDITTAGTKYVTKNECITLGYVGEEEVDLTGTDNQVFAIQAYKKNDTASDGTDFCEYEFTPNYAQKNQLSTTQRIRVKVADSDNEVNNQLYRNVEFVLRERYKIQNLQISKDTDDDNCFTLTVDIPAGLPKEIFPLTFCFETDPPCTYPNAKKSIMEVDGVETSIFDPTNTDSFVYHRDVTYAHYTDGEHFETKDGYTSITFFFKILDAQIESGNPIKFAVSHDAFSTDPNSDIENITPKYIYDTYKFTSTTSDDDSSKIFELNLPD